MIYLIGGAPRIGKSIIAKQLARDIKAKFVSTDELEKPDNDSESVIFYEDSKKNTLTPEERIESVKKEAEEIIAEIESIIGRSVNQSQDIVIEGVHLFPNYVYNFLNKFGKGKIKAIFSGSTNIKFILEGLKKSTGPNNWHKDFNQEVQMQIALFVQVFSKHLIKECKKYGLEYKERSNDFKKDGEDILRDLCG